MKNKKLLPVLLMVIMVLAFFGCTKTPKLLTPSNLAISPQGLISWDAVDNADGYRVTIDGNTYTVADTCYQVGDASNSFTCFVVAIAKGCEDSDVATATFTPTPVIVDEIPADAVLTARSESVTINDDEFDNYDFATLFSLRNDTNIFAIKSDQLDLTHVSKTDGGYIVCNVGERTARINVVIHKRIYHLTLSENSVTAFVDDAAYRDYTYLFTATADGEAVRIDPSMVTSDIENEAGQYRYTVNFHGEIKTLIVNVLDRVVITAGRKSLTIEDYELDGYNFAALFSMTVNGVRTRVTDEYIDISQVGVGKNGNVICSRGLASESISVFVHKNVFDVNVKQDEVTLHTSIVEGYDFVSYFTATQNGVDVAITQDMITSNVKAEVGEYAYTVTLRDACKTLVVNVTDVHQVVCVRNYPDLELQADQADVFDYTRLFALYVDEKSVKVTSAMVDAGALDDAEIGETYQVTLTYTDEDGRVTTATAPVKVVAEASVQITARNVVTYPNAIPIDLLSLFSITDGVDEIAVTSEMVSGSVDYSKEGDNVITLTYGTNAPVTATVTVKRGVIINTRSDVVTIRKGTDKTRYFFEDDFELVVNGVKIPNVFPFLDVSNVDFATVGEYTAVISVNYNDVGFTETTSNQPSTSFEMQVVTAEIIYKVVENIANVTINANPLVVYANDKSFNPLANISVSINGARQTLVADASLVKPLCCYAEVVKTIDTAILGAQSVVIKLYVDGLDNEPQLAEYAVHVQSTAKLTAKDAMIFVGDTLYTKDLFTITDNGVNVPVTYDMLSGGVDMFTPGLYQVELSYQGAKVTARVVVFEQSVRGTYATYATTISTEEEEDEEGWTTIEATSSRRYGHMCFTDGKKITVDDVALSVVQVIDEHTLVVKWGTNNYTMHMFDGIVVLDPDNSLKLGFSNTKRPLVYFNENIWNMDLDKGKLIVNYGSQHVLATTYISYTIEVYTVTSKIDNSTRRLALYVRLANKTSADTIYVVNWGEATLNSDFTQTNGAEGTLIYDNNTYNFVMQGYVTGKVQKETDNGPKYTGIFRNSADNSVLQITSGGKAVYKVANKTVVDVSSYEIANMRNGGLDLNNNIVFLYDTTAWYSYKFTLNPADKTFQLVRRDNLYGYYTLDNMYVFLDGYGTGLISFNTTSYNSIQFRYRHNADRNEIELTYFNNEAYSQFGSGATFYILDTLNVLVAKELYDDTLVGKEFCNTHIIDGAIVRFDNVNVTKDISRQNIVDYITVITKDGELTAAQKKTIITYNTVDRYQSGVYQIKINVSVGGKTLTCYYAVQTFIALDPAPVLANNYSQSVIAGGTCALSVDAYGLATITYNGEKYTGNVTYYGDNRFIVRAKSANNLNVILTGEAIADGIIYVSCTGAVNFFDYFTTGASTLAGDGEYVLRKITVNNADTFVWATGLSSTGSVAQVQVLGKDVYSVTVGASTMVVRVLNWGDGKAGLQMSDSVRGTYSSGDNTLSLDGFGNATVNNSQFNYIVNANGSITCINGDNVAVYRINRNEGTFQQLDIAIDNTLVEGKVFSASYMFVCGSAPYSATTSFTFARDGVVTVKSTSSEHDEGEDRCDEDVYSPPFVADKSQAGAYSVKGNKVTVTISNTNGDFTFVFEIVDLTVANRLNCIATSLDADAHGHFAVNTVFVGFIAH